MSKKLNVKRYDSQTEWKYVLTDSANKVLAGVRQDGSLFIADLS